MRCDIDGSLESLEPSSRLTALGLSFVAQPPLLEQRPFCTVPPVTNSYTSINLYEGHLRDVIFNAGGTLVTHLRPGGRSCFASRHRRGGAV